MALALPLPALGGGLPGLDSLTGLLGGGLPSLPGLGGGLPVDLGSLTGGTTPPINGDVNAGDNNAGFDLGGLGLTDLTGLLGGLGGGLPGLPSLPGLGGDSGGGNGTVYGTDGGLLGPVFHQFESAVYGIPILGQNVAGALGTQVEGGGFQNIVLTQLYGTPLFGPVQGLIGGNSYGDELVLYDLATRPVALTEGIPIVNDVTREIVTGSFAQTTAFIGAYSGGLLSEDLLQNFVSTDGTVGSLANAFEAVLVNVPGGNFIFDGDDLNSALDQVTNVTDQILYVDDLTAGLLGGDKLSNELPFDHAFGGLLGSVNTAGIAAPVGDVFYSSITPLLTIVQEVTIAGAITNGSLGKLI